MTWLSKQLPFGKPPFPELCDGGQLSRSPSVKQALSSPGLSTILSLAKNTICCEVIFVFEPGILHARALGFCGGTL